MDSSDNSELTFNFPPFLRVFKDGKVERLYIPKITYPSQKLPLLIYFHGGGFCIETSSSPTYHNYLDSLVAEGNVVAVSVNYRRAPEDPLPVAYDDCWTAFKWVVSHSNSQGLEPWLNDNSDFNHLFLAGDDAGANLATTWPYEPGLESTNWKKARVDTLWHFVCPTTSGCDDPLINPATDPQLRSLGCQKVLIFLAEKDMLRDRGWFYYETLGKSGWDGVVDLTEAEAEDHVFHIFKPTCEKAVAMRKRMALFLNPQNFN
ncbi:putative carboxylesterase 2 [Vitis vinifera]|uniref:Putative carboxylesterase 2 n=1 Tax=Vitis vinifera TaxID=29760 RepID=A0A438EPS5_VITVI|nr:putative carboxylesterase 2 [Vitis vinifera]